jgi:hypothetical protein
MFVERDRAIEGQVLKAFSLEHQDEAQGNFRNAIVRGVSLWEQEYLPTVAGVPTAEKLIKRIQSKQKPSQSKEAA